MNGKHKLYALGVALVSLGLLFSGCSKNATGDDEVDDGTSPDPISDLTVSAFTSSSVTLSWTASGDDGDNGTAARYDLRYDNAPINWATWGSCTQVDGEPAPKPAGSTETMTVTGLTEDSTYFFALMVYDEAGNADNPSNCVSAICLNDFTITFADSGLEAAVREKLSKPAGDILKSEVISLYDLLADERDISDLSGIQHFTGLHILNLANNDITDISLLESLTKLEQIHISQNNISDVSPLSSLVNLEWLRLDYNDITDIVPLANLVNVNELDLRHNAIVDISALEGLTRFTRVGLSENQIVDISPLVDNVGLGNADEVSLDLNPLSHESITNLIPALRARGVTVHWTADVVAPSTVMDLTPVDIGETSVTLAWTAPGDNLLSGTAYEFDLRYSTDSTVLAGWTAATEATGEPAPSVAGTLETTTVSGLTTNTKYYFAVKTRDNSDNWSEISNIASASPFTDVPVDFADANLEQVVRDSLGKPTGDIYKTELLAIQGLDATGKGIADISGIENCLNLKVLHIGDNSISDIQALSGLTGIWDLNIQNNLVTSIVDLSGLSSLGVLQISGNNIADLSPLTNFSLLYYLAAINISNSDLTIIGGITTMQFLFLSGNGISDIGPLASLSQLAYLYLDINQISDLTPLEGLEHLQHLYLRYNQIVDLQPLVNNAGLGSGDTIALENNPLSQYSIDTLIPELEGRGATVTH